MQKEDLILLQLKSSDESAKTQFKYINRRIDEMNENINSKLDNMKADMNDKITENSKSIKLIDKEIEALNKFRYEYTAIAGVIIYLMIQIFNKILDVL